ncbi:hypothetical protein [Fibrobacter sp.]|uniref:hypothetical protein n=1 Tax=Fibrobacter sp. TaxID=35828 RepID=UPI003890FDED
MKGIEIKELVKKVDAKKVWGFASVAVTVIGAVISSKNQEAERSALKEELKEEILKEVLPKS